MDKAERSTICNVLIVKTADAKKFKNELEHFGILDKQFRILKSDDYANKVAIPIIREKFDECQSKLNCKEFLHSQMLMPFSKAHLIKSDFIYKNLLDAILDEFYAKTNQSAKHEFLQDVPKSWQIHGDLLMLPKNSMREEIWKDTLPDILNVFCKVLNIKRIARHSNIANDNYRSPKADLLLGDNGWVVRRDNGITYTYDITKCMFSDGNITEKLRLASLNCKGETVVDLFAGIGYFVLPFLVHAKAELVYACEWNPDAVEALRGNLKINGVDKRCIILEGDNKKVAPCGIADRVNLGLIPSSEESWYSACAALKPQTGGWLHIHANVDCKPQNEERIKSLTPKSKNPGDNREHVGGNWSHRESDAEATKDNASPELTKNCDNSFCVDSAGMQLKSLAMTKEDCTTSSSSLKQDLCSIFSSDDSYQNQKNKHQMKKGLSNVVKREYWSKWAEMKAEKIKCMLENIHKIEITENWQCDIRHIEHVKSYAPHVDHIVIDMECRPTHYTNA